MGDEWDLRQMASQTRAPGSCRSHAIAQAAGRDHVRAALVSATAGANGVHDTLLQSCLGRQETSFDWRTLSFRMWCRAGAETFTIVWWEQSVYPWRRFDKNISMEEIRADVASGRHCWVDPSTVEHADKYPTVEEMKSAASCAETKALSRLVEPSTAAVERGHSHMKRLARPHEQTHAQRVRDASAYRIASHLSMEDETWYAEVARRDFPQAHAPTLLETAAEQPRKGKKRKAAVVVKPQKKRCGSRCRAWMQANKGAEKFSAALYERYRQAMRDPEEARKYAAAGMALHAAGGVARRRRRWTAVDRQLRIARVRAKRSSRAWCPKAARAKVHSQMQERWNVEWERRKADLHEQRRARHQRNVDARAAMTKPEAMVESPPLPAPLAEVLGHELAREPDSSWRWCPAVRNVAEKQVAARDGLEDRLRQWEAMHFTLDSKLKVRPDTVGNRRKRLCREAGRCLCHGDNRPSGAILTNFRNALHASTGSKKGQPKTQTRAAMDNAAVIVRFIGERGEAADQEWCLLARVSWDTKMATFLHLHKTIEDGERASLRVLGRISAREPFLGWYVDHEFFARFDLKFSWRFELWAFTGVRLAVHGGYLMTATRKNGEQHQFWQGGDDIARAMAEHGDDDDDEDAPCEDEDDQEEAVDIEGHGTGATNNGAESPVAPTHAGTAGQLAGSTTAQFDPGLAEVMDRAARILQSRSLGNVDVRVQ